MTRGELWWADFGIPFGSEPGFKRPVSKRESKLKKDSVITISQIEVVDRHRLLEKISKLDRTIIDKVENNILFILGISKV